MFTVNNNYNPPIYTLWLNGQLISLRGSFPTSALPMTGVAWHGFNVSSVHSMYASDYQMYCGVDLSESTSHGAAANIYMPSLDGVSTGRMCSGPEWWGHGPPIYVCPTRTPTSRFVSEMKSFYEFNKINTNKGNVFLPLTMTGVSLTSVQQANSGGVMVQSFAVFYVNTTSIASTPYTVAFWFSAASFNASTPVSVLAQSRNWVLSMRYDTGLCFASALTSTCTGSPMSAPYFVAGRSLAFAEWNHVVITALSTGYYVFLNGQPLFRLGTSDPIPVNSPLPSIVGFNGSGTTVYFADLQVYSNARLGAETSLYFLTGCDGNTPLPVAMQSATPARTLTPPSGPPRIKSCSSPLHWYIGASSGQITKNYGLSSLPAVLSKGTRWVQDVGGVMLSSGTGRFQAPATYYGDTTRIHVSSWLKFAPATSAWYTIFDLGLGIQITASTQTFGGNTAIALCLTRYASLSAASSTCPPNSFAATPVYVQNDWFHIIFSASPTLYTLAVSGQTALAVNPLAFVPFSEAYGTSSVTFVTAIGARFSERDALSQLFVGDLQVGGNPP